MNSSIISLLILISTLLLPSFCDDNPFDCSTDDLQLTVTCRPALAKLTEEMRKNPLSGVMPSSDTLHKMSAHCRDASNCMKSARCSAIRNKMQKFSKTCNTIEFMAGPYAQCASKLSTEQKCAQFKAKKSCIEQDFGKFCGAATMKDFRDNLDYVSKFVGCPVH
uniref:T20D4.11-like domain-containing protein n=1 Tax=Caenorhabditis japonica TaxID=281687 RepID=A0A8R1DES8_CAEJA